MNTSNTAQSTVEINIANNVEQRNMILEKATSRNKNALLKFQNGTSTVTLRSTSPSDLEKKLKTILNSVDDQSQVDQAKKIIREIAEFIDLHEIKNPIINLSTTDDGVLGLSWKLNNALLGIEIEKDPKETHWFILVSCHACNDA